MSHIVTIKTEIRDPDAVHAACRRLGLKEPAFGMAKIYKKEHSGIIVHLPDWQYPIVCKTETGELLYDNFEGNWGSETELYRFQQSYAIEKTMLEARKQGYSVAEQHLDDGSVILNLQR